MNYRTCNLGQEIRTRNKTTKENDSKTYTFIVGDSMIKKLMATY